MIGDIKQSIVCFLYLVSWWRLGWGNVKSRHIKSNVKRFLGFGADRRTSEWENGVEDHPDEVDELSNSFAQMYPWPIQDLIAPITKCAVRPFQWLTSACLEVTENIKRPTKLASNRYPIDKYHSFVD